MESHFVGVTENLKSHRMNNFLLFLPARSIGFQPVWLGVKEYRVQICRLARDGGAPGFHFRQSTCSAYSKTWEQNFSFHLLSFIQNTSTLLLRDCQSTYSPDFLLSSQTCRKCSSSEPSTVFFVYSSWQTSWKTLIYQWNSAFQIASWEKKVQHDAHAGLHDF